MCARTTKNTHWSGWVEPAAKPEDEGAKEGPLTFVKRDPAWVREMVPMFPITSFVKDSGCPHHGPIKVGSVFVCMVCHQSGMDPHPALQRNPLTDPKPEPAPPSAPLTRESNKQKRKREKREAAAKRSPSKAA